MLNQSVSTNQEEKLVTPEIHDYKSLIISHLETHNNLLTPLIKPLKQQTTCKHKQAMTDYAFFRIDEPTIAKENHYKQLSFEEIIAHTKEVSKSIRRQILFFMKTYVLIVAPQASISTHT